MENLPLGFITGEQYTEQSIKLDPGDMILAFSDGATEVKSPAGTQLSPEGFLDFAHSTLQKLPPPRALPDFSTSLLAGIHEYGGRDELDDDLTLLTLRRVS
jgi:serine phosphatase RsbU (regulator of sigma subunit)